MYLVSAYFASCAQMRNLGAKETGKRTRLVQVAPRFDLLISPALICRVSLFRFWRTPWRRPKRECGVARGAPKERRSLGRAFEWPFFSNRKASRGARITPRITVRECFSFAEAIDHALNPLRLLARARTCLLVEREWDSRWNNSPIKLLLFDIFYVGIFGKRSEPFFQVFVKRFSSSTLLPRFSHFVDF